MSDTTLIWGEIDGRTITFPMEVTAMDAATMVFSVPADAAQRLLPGDDFDVIDPAAVEPEFGPEPVPELLDAVESESEQEEVQGEHVPMPQPQDVLLDDVEP